jgi:hypothetical protein
MNRLYLKFSSETIYSKDKFININNFSDESLLFKWLPKFSKLLFFDQEIKFVQKSIENLGHVHWVS